MPALRGLRPTTLLLLDGLTEQDVGATMAELAARLGVAERTVRRAFRELETAGYVRCARTSDRRKYLAALDVELPGATGVADPSPDPRVSRDDRARMRPQNGPNRPKPAHKPAHKPAQTGPNRPKPAQPQASIATHSLKRAESGAVPIRGGVRKVASPPSPPPQLLLGMEGSADDRARSDARAAMRSLDAVLRHVWERRQVNRGFIPATSEMLDGLATAMRRYSWEAIVECMRWSAERCADGRLDPRMLATTFRGGAFDSRHADWQRDLERAQLRAVRAAEAAERA